jgi:hypothetical protein
MELYTLNRLVDNSFMLPMIKVFVVGNEEQWRSMPGHYGSCLCLYLLAQIGPQLKDYPVPQTYGSPAIAG